MSRLFQIARWLWRHSLYCMLLIAWALLTWLVYEWTPQAARVERFDWASASWELSEIHRGPNWSMDRTEIVGNSADGSILVTQVDPQHLAGSSWVFEIRHGPVRVWDIREGKLLNEFATRKDRVREVTLSPDGSWLSMERNGLTEIYSIASGKRFAFYVESAIDHRFGFHGDYEGLCHSNSGQWVAYRHKNTLEIFDPRAETIRTIFDPSLDNIDPFEFSVVHGQLCAFSCDDRWLAVQAWLQTGKEGWLVLLDVDAGRVVARLPISASIGDVRIARDKKTVAFTSDRDLVVMDIFKQETLITLRDVRLLGWDAAQKNVIVHRIRNHFEKNGEPSRLESWSLVTGEREHYWEIPAEQIVLNHLHYVSRNRNRVWDAGLPALSPDGSRIIWASFHSTVAVLEPGVPDPDGGANRGYVSHHFLGDKSERRWTSDCHYKMSVMSTRDFNELAQWRIDVDREPWGEVPTLKWCPIDNRVFFSDSQVVEIWRVPPRSLSQSAGIAMVPTWTLGGLCYLFACWRTRRRNTITPTAPPPSPA